MCSCVYYYEGAKTPLPLNEIRRVGFGVRCEKSNLDLDFIPPPPFLFHITILQLVISVKLVKQRERNVEPLFKPGLRIYLL